MDERADGRVNERTNGYMKSSFRAKKNINLGSEFVLYLTDLGWAGGGTGRGTGEAAWPAGGLGGGESSCSARRANSCCSGMLLRRPYLSKNRKVRAMNQIFHDKKGNIYYIHILLFYSSNYAADLSRPVSNLSVVV